MAPAVGNERLIRKLQHVDVVRKDLAAFLVRLGVALRASIASLRRGVPASSQTPEATAMHVELVHKLDDMHSAVHQARAEGVRVLVEDEGLPVSTVARLMGRPRQLVARLYQQARTANGGPAAENGRRDGERDGRVASDDAGRAPSGAGARTQIPPAAQ